MNDFNQLQELWEGTQLSNSPLNQIESDTNSLFARLKAFENFQNRINRFKLIAITAISISLIYSLTTQLAAPLISYAGLSIILAGTAAFMFYYFKNQFNTRKLNYIEESTDFIKNAIARLEKQKKIFKKPFMFFSGCILVGFNLLCYGVTTNNSIADRIILHVSFSAFLVASFTIGLFVRKWRTKKEADPLLDELYSINENLISEK